MTVELAENKVVVEMLEDQELMELMELKEKLVPQVFKANKDHQETLASEVQVVKTDGMV